MRFGLGCEPCPPDAVGTDELEALLMLPLGASTADVKTKLDLTSLVKSIRNQGKYGTCVGFGVTQAAANCARQMGFENFEDLSALAAYVQARAIGGILKRPGDGATLSAGMTGLFKGGYMFDSEYPYKPELRYHGFKLGQGQKGLRRAGVRTHRIVASDLELAVRSLLSNGKGVAGSWLVSQPFEDWTPNQGPWDGLGNSPPEGGHCMNVLDYPDGLPRLANSWGTDVGDNGFWTITWNALREATSLWAVEFIP